MNLCKFCQKPRDFSHAMGHTSHLLSLKCPDYIQNVEEGGKSISFSCNKCLKLMLIGDQHHQDTKACSFHFAGWFVRLFLRSDKLP